MNTFTTLTSYKGKWKVKSIRKFTEEEIKSITRATVIRSKHGNSVKFTITGGKLAFIPLDQNSNLEVGKVIDFTKVDIVILCKTDKKNINRVKYLIK